MSKNFRIILNFSYKFISFISTRCYGFNNIQDVKVNSTILSLLFYQWTSVITNTKSKELNKQLNSIVYIRYSPEISRCKRVSVQSQPEHLLLLNICLKNSCFPLTDQSTKALVLVWHGRNIVKAQRIGACLQNVRIRLLQVLQQLGIGHKVRMVGVYVCLMVGQMLQHFSKIRKKWNLYSTLA